MDEWNFKIDGASDAVTVSAIRSSAERVRVIRPPVREACRDSTSLSKVPPVLVLNLNPLLGVGERGWRSQRDSCRSKHAVASLGLALSARSKPVQ
jgi:hypothetical protein